jgi:hypothetical protein
VRRAAKGGAELKAHSESGEPLGPALSESSSLSEPPATSDTESEFEAAEDTFKLSYVTTRRAWAEQIAASDKTRK